MNFHKKLLICQTDILLKFWDCSGAKGCKSCRAWKMLSNAYFLAKVRFDTAENEPAKNLQNFFFWFNRHLFPARATPLYPFIHLCCNSKIHYWSNGFGGFASQWLQAPNQSNLGRKSWTESSWEKNPFFLGYRTLFNSRAFGTSSSLIASGRWINSRRVPGYVCWGVRGSKIGKILQIFSGLVLGCIRTKFCKKICVWQHFSSSTRFAYFCTAAISKF